MVHHPIDIHQHRPASLGILLSFSSFAALVQERSLKKIWAIIIVMFGVVLFDFAANVLDGTVKAYLFDVCSYIDKERGLHYHTLLTGLGGAFGYLMGAMDWGHSSLGRLLGSEYQVIYFFSALTWTVFLIVHLSIQETPLVKDGSLDSLHPNALLITNCSSGCCGSLHGSMSKELEPDLRPCSFSALTEADSVTSSSKQPNKEKKRITLKSCLLAMINIPSHYRCLCVTYLLGWTKGNPYADHNSTAYEQYERRVEIGCWGLCINSVSLSQRLLRPCVDLKGLYFVGYFVVFLMEFLKLILSSCDIKRIKMARLPSSVIVVVLFTSTMSLLGCLFIALFIRYVE
uniref:Solute carrier family 45 member 2 n=1 Tax=Salmo trutta TaxID=8032 RepID=A0A674A553_SALTR